MKSSFFSFKRPSSPPPTTHELAFTNQNSPSPRILITSKSKESCVTTVVYRHIQRYPNRSQLRYHVSHKDQHPLKLGLYMVAWELRAPLQRLTEAISCLCTVYLRFSLRTNYLEGILQKVKSRSCTHTYDVHINPMLLKVFVTLSISCPCDAGPHYQTLRTLQQHYPEVSDVTASPDTEFLLEKSPLNSDWHSPH